MDSITKSLLKNFAETQGFSDTLSETDLFEHFAAYSLLSHEVGSPISKSDLEGISAGKSKGIDTIACCVNDKIIFDVEELKNYKSLSLNVDMFFLQSKTTEGFSDAEAGSFLDTVIDLFKDTPSYKSPEFDSFREIYTELLTNLSRITFNLHCYYITLGVKHEGETSLQTTIKLKKQALDAYTLFEQVEIELIDKSKLINKHKKAINPLKATFKFDNKNTLYHIPKVEEAYIGFIPFSEFKKLILDEEGDKIKSLFNDNLRDFLGIENSVNEGIKKTLDQGRFNEFSLLNNGITVVADNNLGKGNTLVLENYQIVNGCQTSNVLYQCRNLPNIDEVLIPLKVVITKDSDLRDAIILSTNSQSKFEESELFALTEFQKTLEDYYNSQQQYDNLYYERRTNQYASRGISRTNIVDIKEQLKSFMAMFYNIPHIVAGNVGKVAKNYKNKFFQKEHNPQPYYISGLISMKWDKLQKEDDNFKEFNKYRYHIFMGFRILCEDITFHEEYIQKTNKYSKESLNGSKILGFEKLLENLRDDEKFKSIINEAITIFKQLDYKRPKGAYSNPITQEFIIKLNDISRNHVTN